MTQRFLIVDDNAHFLEAARDLLQREGMVVAGVASTSAEALVSAAELEPDAILVDVDLGEESGFDLAEVLVAAGNAHVVLISAHDEVDLADLISSSVALGFVSKSDLSARAILDLLEDSAGGVGR